MKLASFLIYRPERGGRIRIAPFYNLTCKNSIIWRKKEKKSGIFKTVCPPQSPVTSMLNRFEKEMQLSPPPPPPSLFFFLVLKNSLPNLLTKMGNSR